MRRCHHQTVTAFDDPDERIVRDCFDSCGLVGHADTGVTWKIHAHVMPGDDEAAAADADRLVSGLTGHSLSGRAARNIASLWSCVADVCSGSLGSKETYVLRAATV